MNIRTKYKTNAKGTGQILAKGLGKQLTHTFDPALPSHINHGHAAGLLLRKVTITSAAGTAKELENRCTEVAAGHMAHDSNDAGTEHVFTV